VGRLGEGRQLDFASIAGEREQARLPEIVWPHEQTVSWGLQVKALVELVTSLMCTSRPSSGRQAPTLPSNFQDMMRDMVDAGVRKALLQVLRGLDVNHPKVS